MRRSSILALIFAAAGCYRSSVFRSDAAEPTPEVDAGTPTPGCGAFSAERCRLVGGVYPYVLASVGDRLYWVELGTPSGSDGTLRAVSLDGGPVETIAAGLEDPVNLQVTSAHAYIDLNHYGSTGSPRGAIVRMPIEGGPLEVVAEDAVMVRAPCYQCFVTHGDRAYFPLFHGVFAGTIATSSIAEPTASTFVDVPDGVYAMAGDADYLYFMAGTTPWEIQRVAWTGGAPELVATLPGVEACPFVVTDGFIIAAECTDEWREVFLTRMPLEGGGWERIAQLEAQGTVRQITILSGGRWIADQYYPDPTTVTSGILGSPTVTTLVTTASFVTSVATERGVFFVSDDEMEIHRVAW